MLFKSAVWERLSDFQFCEGGGVGNGRGKLTKCPNYFVRGCRWVVGDYFHSAQFFPFHDFFLHFESQFDQKTKRTTLRKSNLFLRGTKPIRVGCALLQILKLWLDKLVLAACRRSNVLFVILCVRAALERNMSPNIFVSRNFLILSLRITAMPLCVLSRFCSLQRHDLLVLPTLRLKNKLSVGNLADYL